ncbi:MAG: hypothetical protein ACRD3D_02045 [Terriglobia bacterium]
MRKFIAVFAFFVASASVAFPQTQGAKVYINPGPDGFASAVAAALLKKGTPVEVMTSPTAAQYEVSYSLLSKQGNRGAQVAAGVLAGAWWVGRASVTVSFTVADLTSNQIVYSYTVHKAANGSKQFQSAAEAFAKHWSHWIEHTGK